MSVLNKTAERIQQRQRENHAIGWRSSPAAAFRVLRAHLRWPKRRLAICGCAIAAIGGALAFAQTRRLGPERSAAASGDRNEYLTNIAAVKPAGRAAEAGEIGTQRVQAVVRRAVVRLTGSLQADEKSDVGSNAMGNVSATLVNRGSVVKKGDVLIEIDPRDAQYALDEGLVAAEQLRVRLGLDESKEFRVEAVPEVESAKLALSLAERNYRRGESLKKQNAIATSDADQMETDYRSAVHRYHLAVFVAKQLYQNYRQATTHLVALRKAVEDCTIRAPFDGLVASRDISVGERVIAMFPGAKLATVLRIDPLRLSLTVPQQEMSKIKIGQTATFQTDAFPGETFTARVRYITPQLNCDNRSLVVEAVAPNHDGRLLPGLFVAAELQLDQRRSDLYVPQAAVRSRNEVAAVFVLRGGVFREQIVSLGEAAGGRVRVASGLSPDDVVVTTPERVRDGDSQK